VDTATITKPSPATQVFEPGFELRQHLRAVACLLHNASHHALSHSHRRKLRRLAALVDVVSPALAVIVERSYTCDSKER
jgi:hypothetical protein